MLKIDPSMNGRKVNPLIISKPTINDPTIEDIYLDGGEDKYIYKQGYVRSYFVVIVKRITLDMVRKSSLPFNSKDEALGFMKNLYGADDVQSQISEYEISHYKDIHKEENELISENMESVQEDISNDDEEFSTIPEKSCTKPMKKKWDI